jgi:xanthine dehydrogenase YagT iron-sulfur-binding subunit
MIFPRARIFPSGTTGTGNESATRRRCCCAYRLRRNSFAAEPSTITVEPRTMLLDVLREQLALIGAKKGCDRGECGARTVHVDGSRVLSCMIEEAEAG